MAHRIQDIEGLGEKLGTKLMDIGIYTVEKLLEAGADRKGRAVLHRRTGISPKQLLSFVNMADLYRIRGVGSEYAELLEEAGIDSVVELAHRRPDHLRQKMCEVNDRKHLVRAMPSVHQIDGWIKQAKKMPRVIKH